MRTSFNGGILEQDGAVLGYNLGADYCAEHEWGIKDLRKSFGMSDDKLGIEKRTVSIDVGLDLILRDVGGGTILLYEHSFAYDKDEAKAKRREERVAYSISNRGNLFLGSKPTAAAWDGASFGIYTKDPKVKKLLIELRAAFERKDAAIWLGGGGFFENAGLVLVIVSRLPTDRIKKMREQDEDRVRLLDRAAGTKIEEVLKAAGKSWFALSPQWANKERDKTNYDVTFYLNPMEQDIHHSGSFTVEELRQWAENKGPVMRQKRARGR